MSKRSEYVAARRANLRALNEWIDQNFPEGYIVAPILEHFAKNQGLPMEPFGDGMIDKDKLLAHGWSGSEGRSLAVACDLFEAAKTSGGSFDEHYTGLMSAALARLSWRLLVGERPVHALQPGSTPPWTGQTNWSDYVAEQLGSALGQYVNDDRAYQEEVERQAREEREQEHRATKLAELVRWSAKQHPRDYELRLGYWGLKIDAGSLQEAQEVALPLIAGRGFWVTGGWTVAENDWGVPTTEATIEVEWAGQPT